MCFDGRVPVSDIAAGELVELSVVKVVFAGSKLIVNHFFDIGANPFVEGSDRDNLDVRIDAADGIQEIAVCLSERCRFFIGDFSSAIF